MPTRDDDDRDPTVLPEGAEVVGADDANADNDASDQGGNPPDDALMEELHGAAWQQAQDAQDSGLLDELAADDAERAAFVDASDPMDGEADELANDDLVGHAAQLSADPLDVGDEVES
ncbi:MAG TPA: hypothetical protein VLE97_08010 [Gaiellaceae bacterium]|nr:hypothetical protein [Gaiellaceae bacterium]